MTRGIARHSSAHPSWDRKDVIVERPYELACTADGVAGAFGAGLAAAEPGTAFTSAERETLGLARLLP